VRLYAEPYAIFTPVHRTAPFVFASPHSGRLYPSSFVKASRLGPTGLRRSEDAFVDELFMRRHRMRRAADRGPLSRAPIWM
jgi:N-formylglutamate amidohydrolase